MKTYNSMYLGLCVNNNDPDFRGRVQVFVPHIMPALFDGWNKEGKDIQITCVGDNMVNGLDGDMLDKLKNILPWAEAASPILCGSSPGMVVRDANGKAVLNQSPVSDGTAYASAGQQQQQGSLLAPNDNEKDLFKNALKYAGAGTLGDKVRANFAADGSLGSKRACARGTFATIGALTNSPAFQTGSVGGDAKDYAQGGKFSNSSENRFTKSGLYNAGQPIGGTVPPNPQIGDVIAKGEHIQVYNGVRWVSDFSQSGVGGAGNNGMLYRMNQAGLEAVKKNSPGLFEQSIGTSAGKQNGALTYTDSSAKPPAAPAGPQYTADPVTASGIPDSAAAVPGTNASQGAYSSEVLVDGKGLYNPASLRDDAYNYLLATNPSFLSNPPAGAAALGALQAGTTINGKLITKEQAAASWANIAAKFNVCESEGKLNPPATQDPGRAARKETSEGAGQWSPETVNRVWGNSAGVNVTAELLRADPTISNRAFFGMVQEGANKGVPIFRPQFDSSGRMIANERGFKLQSGGVGYPTMQKLADSRGQTLEEAMTNDRTPNKFFSGNKSLLKVGGATINGGDSIRNNSNATAMIMNPDSGGLTPVTNTNNMPKGLFTYPAVGAMIWVFFREGNPLYPVYFAASYSANEWMGAYGNTSPAVGNPGEKNPPGVATQSTVFNTGAGGMVAKQVIDQNDPTQTSSSFALHGPGGQITFTDAKAYMYFRNDLRHQVEGALHESVLGIHESLIQGDSNSVFLGARVIKVGNITPDAIAAAQELQKLLEEIQSPLSKPSAKPGETGGKILNSNSIAQNVA